MKKNKAEKKRPTRKQSKTKKIVISVIAIVLVLAMGCGVWYYYGHRNTDPVYVYNFYDIGQVGYWGDSKESYGPVSTDKIQTVFLSGTQTVTEVFVNEGDTVSKGDPLMAFDTTLSDMALERKRLDVEKLKLQLDDANAELKRIKALKPMVIHQSTPKPTTPTTPNTGTPISGPYQITSKDTSDGSSQSKALICWLKDSTEIDDELYETLRQKAEELQLKNKPGAEARTVSPAEDPTEDPGTDPADPVTPDPSDPSEATDPSETTEPTAPATEPTDPSEATEPTDPGTEPIEPPQVTVDKFYVVFKVTDGNTSLGDKTTWQGVYVQKVNGSFKIKFFDASGIRDTVTTTPTTTPSESGSSVDYNSGYTSTEISKMRAEQEKTIKDLQFSVKMAEAEYKIMQTEVSDGKVYAEIDGTVVSILSADEAMDTQQPMIKVSGGGGFYVEGSVSELDKDSLMIGQEVTINDWNTGNVYTGTVEKIGDYPTNNDSYWGAGNPNASYYPFTVFVNEDADLQPGFYVSVQYSTENADGGIYLNDPFIRTENGKSYVYVQNADGLLEKRYVTTGKSLWGSSTEILGGIDETDLIAFPYGKNVKEGAPTVEGDMSNLYDGY